MAGTTPRLYISIKQLDQRDRDAGMALGQRLDAQRQRQPADADLQQRPHADGVAAQAGFPEGQNVVGVDALIGQLAEAGVDAVDGGAAGHQFFEATAGCARRASCGRGQAELRDPAGEKGIGIVEGQAGAAEVQGIGGRGCVHAVIVTADVREAFYLPPKRVRSCGAGFRPARSGRLRNRPHRPGTRNGSRYQCVAR